MTYDPDSGGLNLFKAFGTFGIEVSSNSEDFIDCVPLYCWLALRGEFEVLGGLSKLPSGELAGTRVGLLEIY